MFLPPNYLETKVKHDKAIRGRVSGHLFFRSPAPVQEVRENRLFKCFLGSHVGFVFDLV